MIKRLIFAPFITALLLLIGIQPAQANQFVQGCTEHYHVGVFDQDQFCLSVGWHPQVDGTGIVLDSVYVYPEDCSQYNNPSADIATISVDVSLRDGSGINTIWDRTSTTTQSSCGRYWTMHIEAARPCIQGHTRLHPNVANYGDPGYLNADTNRDCRG